MTQIPFRPVALLTACHLLNLIGLAQVVPPVSGPGLALAFNGGMQHASTLSNPITIGPAITIEAWIHASAFNYGEVYALCDDPNSACTGVDYKVVDLRVNPSGQIEIGLSPTTWASRRIYLVSATSISLNTWTHVAGTMDLGTNTGAIYINGIEVAINNYSLGSGTGTFSGSPAIGALQVSGATTGIQYPFTGRIDELRVWNAALPLAAIRDFMCRSNLTGHPYLANLQALYHVDEPGPSTPTVWDHIGDHHATLTNVSVASAYVPSDAALGDMSVHTYSSPNLSLTTPTEGFSISAGDASGKHIYHVAPPGANVDGTLPTGLEAAGGGCFGVFLAQTTPLFYLVNYSYSGNPELDGTAAEPSAVLLRRDGPTATPWTQHAPQWLNQAVNVIDLQGTWQRHAQWAGAYSPPPCTTDLDFVYQADGVDNLTWAIYQETTNILIQSGGGALIGNGSEATCLPDGCFYLVVTDGGGDGIVNGGYLLKINSSVRLIDNLYGTFGEGGFTSGINSQIANNEGFCLPVSTDRLIYTSCDKRDWKISPCGGEFVVANANQDVSDEYGVNNANSGYQMWWYTPNGGYSFKRFQSHNTSNGLPASATRAAHFQLNAWLGNQLTEGGFYNVKVRGRINGNYNNWGPACRLVVNSTEAQCPRTKLQDQPNNPYLSCGQSRTIGTNVYVHARTVRRMNANCNWVNANRYQFRFRIPAEFVTIVKTSATGKYWVNTNGLTCGKTYEVDVRASFNNGSIWCHSSDPYGDVCLLTTTCSFGMAEESSSSAAGQSERSVGLYPNPNNGDQLFVSLSNVEEGVESINVDIYDSFGKRVAQRTLGVQDGFVNTTIALNGELANGMYLVSIAAGSAIHTERLVIQK